MKELLFRNVTLYDGSGNVPFPADVGIKGDKIIAVEKAGTLASGSGEVIEGNGLALTPGFVDVHTHSDNSQHRRPARKQLCAPGSKSINHVRFPLFPFRYF